MVIIIPIIRLIPNIKESFLLLIKWEPIFCPIGIKAISAPIVNKVIPKTRLIEPIKNLII
jgi:hypothetical protein